MSDQSPVAATRPAPRDAISARHGDCPFRVERIDHVVLRCRDVGAMLAFYCDVLGLEVAKRNERLGLIHLKAGSAMIDLVPAARLCGNLEPAAHGSATNMDHVCLRIEPFDYADLERHFRSRGVAIGELRVRYGAEGDGESFYLADPEGNRVELKGPSVK